MRYPLPKPARSDFKAIKCIAFLTLTLALGLFFTQGASATTFSENFDSYNVGDLSGQNDWSGTPSCWVDTIKSFSTPQSISVKAGYGACYAIKSIATTSTGFFYFHFYGQNKDTGTNILYFLGGGGVITITNDAIFLNATTELPNSNWAVGQWHTIGINYNDTENWQQARIDLNNWSATTTTAGPIDNISLSYSNGYRNAQDFFIDDIVFVASYADYTYETLGLTELPALEDCSGYGLTERLMCELKNFFYRLFVPSPEKVNDLKNTMDLIKTKFPYSYISQFQGFLSYIKDNINEEQGVEFKILNETGNVDFSFWDKSTTFSGVPQTFLDLFKMVFRILILVGFGFWCFSFLKRVFK